MSLPCRVARGALARSRWTVPSTTSAAAKIVSPIISSRCSLGSIKCMSTSTSGGSLLTKLATDNPYKDVVRYEHKNRKWNLQHVDYYSEALAIGLLENGLQPGDVVLSWLSPHFSESVS
ncbi:MAG: hypothetical protein ACI8RD_009328 [Bacillariaceae sp.]|jgi:hypothetical protein